MSLRSTLIAGLLALGFVASPALAEPASEDSHLAYYTYYKSKNGETVSAIATKFGLAESSLVRMNPQLADLNGDLPSGSLLCVPNDKKKSLPRSRSRAQQKEAEKVASKEATKTTKKRKKKSKKDSEEPDEGEWETLADYATKGAPKLAARSLPELPPSKLITSDGQVVWIPAAKPKPKPKPKRDVVRSKLSSRKGKAIHGILKTCRSHLGTPYVWGGEQPGGFDCSGYIQYVWAQHGYRVPRTADIQFYKVGKKVKRGKELPGDMVFFETYLPGPSHVGVYLGRGYFIHASSSRGVTIDRLATDFFAQRYLGAKRTKF
jgi:cell wall-associated NlpC family hydrolase